MASWRRQLAAMDAADTEALAREFTPDATLTHMTGYVQRLGEWLDGIQRREFVYHRVVERSVDVTVLGDTARVRGRIITGVTDDGSGQAWPLTTEQDYVVRDGAWRCTGSRVAFG